MGKTKLAGRSLARLLAVMLLAAGLTGGAASARDGGGGGRGGGGGGGRGGGGGGGGGSGGGGGGGWGVVDPQEPVEWMTDYDEAVKLATQENRALLILITTQDLERTCQSCRFAANPTRKAVRQAKVVPLKLLPPAALDLAGLKPEEAKKREAVFNESRKKYEELAKRFGVATVPSLVYAAPDAARLTVQASPADEDIRAGLARLPEMVKTHQEALAKQAKKPEPAGDKDPAGTQPKPAEGKKPATKPGGEDEF